MVQMQLTATLAHTDLGRLTRSRRRGELRTPRRSPSDAERARRAGGGPQDRALYSCACGFAFTATVSTTVGCPHCGTAQAW
jgi:hypothetical protein